MTRNSTDAGAETADAVTLHIDPAMVWARPGRFAGAVPTELAFLAPREQVLLYSLVFAAAPERCLEVGVMYGGGSRIIHAALSDLGRGRLVGLDMAPQLRIDWTTIADRATLLIGKTPGAFAEARRLAGGDFDFVFLDGDHTRAGVRRDLDGLMEVTSPGCTILAHDWYFWEVAQAFEKAVADGLPLRDSGITSTTPNVSTKEIEGKDPRTGGPIRWGGMRVFQRV